MLGGMADLHLTVCPRCGSDETTSIGRGPLLLMGSLGIGLGGLLSFILIGIPILIAGVIMLTMGIFGHGNGSYICRHCNHTWKPGKEASAA